METIYTTKQIKVKGNTFSVLIAKGKTNYISIRKETNNPFKTSGKQFNNFDEAQKNYKCTDMKVQLLMLETSI